MIEHNSEVYNHPYISFFIVHVYMEKDLCRGGCILHCYVRSSLLFPYFLPFWYPYILLHFQMFFITCILLFPILLIQLYCLYVFTFCLWLLLKGAEYGCRLVGCASANSQVVSTHSSLTLKLQNCIWIGRCDNTTAVCIQSAEVFSTTVAIGSFIYTTK